MKRKLRCMDLDLGINLSSKPQLNEIMRTKKLNDGDQSLILRKWSTTNSTYPIGPIGRAYICSDSWLVSISSFISCCPAEFGVPSCKENQQNPDFLLFTIVECTKRVVITSRSRIHPMVGRGR